MTRGELLAQYKEKLLIITILKNWSVLSRETTISKFLVLLKKRLNYHLSRISCLRKGVYAKPLSLLYPVLSFHGNVRDCFFTEVHFQRKYHLKNTHVYQACLYICIYSLELLGMDGAIWSWDSHICQNSLCDDSDRITVI